MIAYRPQLATLVKAPPRGPGWVHEIKYDGYRIGAMLRGGEVTLISRNGKDWTAQFPDIARAVAELPVREVLLDGEACLVLPDGRTSFQALQNYFGSGQRSGIAYFAFDLLWLDGRNLSQSPLAERKAALTALLEDRPRVLLLEHRPRVLQVSKHWDDDGAAVWDEACRLRLEGIVSKRIEAPYRAGRNADWLKVKCIQRQELVIGGFTEPEGAARTGLGALLVGYQEGGRLEFAGKVGTGFTNASAAALRQKLNRIEVKECPFAQRPTGKLGKIAHWVQPDLVAEVEFTEWTEDGKIRHPSFKGLRGDKGAAEVVREAPDPVPESVEAEATKGTAPTLRDDSAKPARKAPAQLHGSERSPRKPSRRAASQGAERKANGPRVRLAAVDGAPVVAGIRISNPDRVLYPDAGVTKLDLVRYYEEISDWILPHLRGRPLTLVHCPDGLAGECRYMKHSKVWARGPIRRVRIREKTKIGEYLVIDDEPALISMAQMNILELHTWNSDADDVERPNRIVFDLDPGPDVPWRDVVDAAREVRAALRGVGLESWVKTTGGAGLHVVVPIAPQHDWTECLAFSREVADALVREAPRRYTVAFAKAGREKLILLDYLRNNRTNTSVAAFSTRARPGAPVSTPLDWDELTARLKPARFSLLTVPKRLRAMRADPWKAYGRKKQRLPAQVRLR